MFKTRTLLAGLSLALLLPFAQAAHAAQSALETFKQRHGEVTKLVKAEAPNEELAKSVDSLLNYKELAVRSLGGEAHYTERCAPKCDEFETLLANLIRRNYLDRIRTSKKYDVVYVGEEAKEDYTKVLTRVTFESDGRPQSVEVAYKMTREGEAWRVVDIITDGVSLSRTYKYEFKKTHEASGIDGLISKLKDKLAELEAE
ncbi:MAG: ABC transporter substrate-binding protein [Myxococcales bacterium]|nr:ABC transporter substrate-binding protein [Myxococcales bacterium]